MKRPTKVILGSAAAMAMCASLIAGSTFALFTSESSVNISVSSAKVDVTATIDENFKTYSYQEDASGAYVSTEMPSGTFLLGGTASLADGRTLNLSNIVPGDRAELQLNIQNNSTVAVKYQIVMSVSGDDGLYRALDVTVGTDGQFIDSELSSTKLTKWEALGAGEAVAALPLAVELPYDATNEAAEKSCTLTVSVQAVQGNAYTTDPVPVDPDDPEQANLVPIYTAAEFKSFRDSVNNGDDYTGKTVKLFNNIALNGEEWSPIGTSAHPFLGDFDGQDHTVFDLAIHSSSSYVGLFGYAGKWANEDNHRYAIKNLTIENAAVNGATWSAAFVGNGTTYLDLENLKLTGHAEITSEKQGAAGIIAYGNYIGSMDRITVDVDETSFVRSVG